MTARPDRLKARRSRLLLFWITGVTFLLVQRPLHAPELWWQLARGREVLSGTLSPSRTLLVLDEANEADWLGGLPFYGAWSVGGVHFLAVLPVLAAWGLLLFASRTSRLPPLGQCPPGSTGSRGQSAGRPPADRSPADSAWGAVLFLPLLLWTIRDGLQPVPQLFDLLGLVAVWLVLRGDRPNAQRLVATGILFLLWANLGTRPIWGLLLLILSPLPRVPLGSLFAAALLGGMLTPRGIFTWWDSAILFAPSAFENVRELSEPGWRGAFIASEWDAAQIAFLLLWGLWVLRGVLDREASRFLPVLTGARWGVPLLAAILSRANIPLCGVWLLLDLLQSRTLENRPGSQEGVSKPLLGSAGIVVACLVLIDAAGEGPGRPARLGWGIAQEIDPRLLDADLLDGRQEPFTAWAPDARSVGVLTWLGGQARMADHPQRALLGGRWPLHVGLVSDLKGAHRARYRRDDGTWGGWVHRLAEWNVEFLSLPVEEIPLNRALVETEWRPVDLDSASVPYVSAEDAHFGGAIIEVMRQQSFVESGPWRPTEAIYDGHGWRYDFMEWIGWGPNPAPAVRQSQLFRSLDLPTASLRALLPIRRRSRQRSLWKEFQAAQNDLAYQEWITFGQASRFRRLVVDALGGVPVEAGEAPWGAAGAPPSETWKHCLDLYLQGSIAEAVGSLPLKTSQEHYGAAMLWLELGETDRALTELDHLLSRESETALTIAAEFWKQQIEAFSVR